MSIEFAFTQPTAEWNGQNPDFCAVSYMFFICEVQNNALTLNLHLDYRLGYLQWIMDYVCERGYHGEEATDDSHQT